MYLSLNQIITCSLNQRASYSLLTLLAVFSFIQLSLKKGQFSKTLIQICSWLLQRAAHSWITVLGAKQRMYRRIKVQSSDLNAPLGLIMFKISGQSNVCLLPGQINCNNPPFNRRLCTKYVTFSSLHSELTKSSLYQ